MLAPGKPPHMAARGILNRVKPDASVLEVFPVILPVLEKTYSVRLDISSEVGMVERWILKMMREFGPIDIHGLDELMGLGWFVLSATINRLIELGVPLLEHGDDSYSLECDPFDRDGRVLSAKRHEMSFLVNGVGGELLPISFLKEHDHSRIAADDVMAITEKYRHWHRLSSVHDESPLPDVGALTREQRLEFGVKDNFVCCDDEEPKATRVFHILAFVARDGEGAHLFSVGRSGTERDDRRFDLCWPYSNDFQSLPMLGGDARERWKKSSERLNEKTVTVLLDNDEVGTLLVTLPDAENLAGASGEADADVQDETTVDKKVETALLWGKWWDFPQSPLYARLLPGNAATAKKVLLEHAAADWARSWNKLGTLEEIGAWWQKFQHDVDFATFKTPVPIGELVDYSRSNRDDSEFLEYLEILFPRHAGKTAGTAESSGVADRTSGTLVLHIPGFSVEEKQWSAPCLRPGEALRELVENAEKSLDVISPMFDDPAALALLEDAVGRGVNVRLVTAIGDKQHIQADKLFRFDGKEADRHRGALQRLARTKCLVRSPLCLPHAKIVIADDGRVLLSSANITSNSLAWDDDRATLSAEAGVLINGAGTVSAMARQFDQVWAACPYRIHHQSRETTENYTVHTEKIDAIPPRIVETAGLRIGFHFPGAPDSLAETLAKALRRARTRVILASLSLYDTKEVPPVHAACLDALRRGVSVTACIRKPDNDKYPDPSTAELMDKGLRLCFIKGMHIKGVLADGEDGEQCGLFSANLTPYSLGPPVAGDPSLRQLEVSVFGGANNPVLKDFARLISILPELEHRQEGGMS